MMSKPTDTLPPTRMLFLGEDSLADGFRLIGFETYPDPTPDEVDRVFRELMRSNDKAFVIVDDAVMHSEAGNLLRVRDEGGRIVVVSVPGLAADPPRLASEIADRLAAMFGNSSLMQAPQ
jgi:vacuolar-type H+-ATPase subunit F/Vma7